MIVRALFAMLLAFGALPAAAQNADDSILYIFAARGSALEIGTGFFVDSAGTFVTAYHVMKNSSSAEVYDRRSRKYSNTQFIIADPTNDIAILTVNSRSPAYLELDSRLPRRGAPLTTIGHPQGFKDQSFSARATQEGLADAQQLRDAQGNRIFTKSVSIIPLDLTIYSGMSGGPLINADGNVVGMISGSFNPGGSLAWAIPAEQILALVRSLPSSRTELSKVNWRPMDAVTSYYRSFAIPRQLGISDTIEWLNDKWADWGVSALSVNNFDAKINQRRAYYDRQRKALKLRLGFGLVGESFEENVTIDLEDALRATAERASGSSALVAVECPRSRSCISYNVKKQSSGGWRTLKEDRTNETNLDALTMVDRDSATRIANAINHLIQLHGGPIEYSGPFNNK